jgi:hypothetical protein
MDKMQQNHSSKDGMRAEESSTSSVSTQTPTPATSQESSLRGGGRSYELSFDSPTPFVRSGISYPVLSRSTGSQGRPSRTAEDARLSGELREARRRYQAAVSLVCTMIGSGLFCAYRFWDIDLPSMPSRSFSIFTVGGALVVAGLIAIYATMLRRKLRLLESKTPG